MCLGTLGTSCGSGSFGEVFQCIVETSNGKVKVAVKVFKIDTSRDTDKIEKAIHRELKVWLRLRNPAIVPLLGIAYVNSPFKSLALISKWMPSGTLFVYLKEATTITASAKVALVKGVAAGLDYRLLISIMSSILFLTPTQSNQ
ncbi:hypothetical protein EV424DRAFT_1426792 [Suillus variegatus]|nr:hypothetical protein EV424DRAFT_1426792 [Suillus variegatus]